MNKTGQFKTIADWKQYLNELHKPVQFDEAWALLNRQQKHPHLAIHPFVKTNQMGLAIYLLDQQALHKNCYRLKSDNTYRSYSH